jgi:hypothetical protein
MSYNIYFIGEIIGQSFGSQYEVALHIKIEEVIFRRYH